MNTTTRTAKKKNTRTSSRRNGVAHSVAMGIGSCIALHGHYYSSRPIRQPKMPAILSDKEAALHDAKALRGDWQQVGSDMDTVLKKFKLNANA